ncbi:sucrase-isomaltase, intestinal-like [Amphibalanus amphitrite]|uniref:sucrase-isomaltase, intestinal-like n=1 Tax=Amphibalanus amphitrite TaxID=1232801 RepID=UPI001C9093B7|nr:sucrase-isomaltase, intestinal-like [Amphibalanus amphitrite]
MKFSWVLLVCTAALAGAADLDCPLPGGPDTASEETCALYSACLWSGDRCLLAEDIGYQLDGPPLVIHTGYEAYLERRRPEATVFGGDVDRLHVLAVEYDDHRLGVSFRDANADRYEVPVPLDVPPLPTDPNYPVYDMSLSTDGEFELSVQHSGAEVLRMLPQFVYSDQFIEATFVLAGSDVYGFGENNHDSFRHDLDVGETWPVFALDRPPGDGVENLYGTHPFFTAIEDDFGHSFGVLFLNSNAMEYRLFRLEDGSTALTFRTTGGILDMYFFFGDSPLEVLRQYYLTIGRPVMPPYWGLGFQLCRYGYTSTDDIRAVRERMKAAQIPQDIQYSDIDYMNVRRDFTIDPRNFSDLPAYVQELREQEEVRFVYIYDPAIAAEFDGGYPSADRGVQSDVFIKWMNASLVPDDQCEGCRDYVVGYVWPESKTLFPDFLKVETVNWWVDEMRRFREISGGADGFWIDMNEPSSFGTNLEKPFNWPDDLPPWSLKCPDTKWDSPPYPTRWVRDPSNESKRLSDHTICMSTVQGNDTHPFLHYDVHNLFGYAEASATRLAMDMLLEGRRGLLVGRSTFPGSGMWTGHWLGDNTARWKDMKRSVVGMLEFNMFGIPYVGADICGFNGASTEELCLRWTQLGAFYPFSRNHNTIGTPAQDPAVWPSVAAAARDALGLRYRLLPYLYTLFWRARAFGEPVVRSLAFQFPTDPALRGVDTQFLWGDGVMVAPILDETSMTSVNVTLPAGKWWDLRDGKLAYSGDITTTFQYHVGMDEMIPVYARAGTILPWQRNETTTAAARRNPFNLSVFGDTAAGELYWDDGESRLAPYLGDFYRSQFWLESGELHMDVLQPRTDLMHQPVLETVLFYGQHQPTAVLVDGEAFEDWSFVEDVLTVRPNLDMATNHTVTLQ